MEKCILVLFVVIPDVGVRNIVYYVTRDRSDRFEASRKVVAGSCDDCKNPIGAFLLAYCVIIFVVFVQLKMEGKTD